MRVPSVYSLARVLAFGVSALLPGLVMRGGRPVAPPAAPPVPEGVVEVGPLTMAASLPAELLTDAFAPLLRYEGLLNEGDDEGDEETAFFHLAGLFGTPSGDPLAAPLEEPYGRPYPSPGAPALDAFEDAEGGEAGFGVTRAASGGAGGLGARRALLTAPRPSVPLLAAPGASLAPWLAAFSPAPRDAPPLLPYVPRDEAAGAAPLRVTLPPVFLAALGNAALRPVFGGIDYTDPPGVGLPLLRVFGYEDAPLSPHFRVGDFATRDGAPLARISPRLVQGLERLRDAVGPFYVISGYRHPAHNAAVGGSRVSQHMAGQAADLYAPAHSSLELARAAVDAFGCGIGLGLGATTVHVDVRGHLATWTYPGAPLSEAAFDLWVLVLCDRVRPADLGGLLQVEWTLPDSLSDVDLLNRLRWLVDDAVPPDSVTKEAAEQLLQRRRLVLSAFARNGEQNEGPGAVLVDLSGGLPPEAAPLRLSYVVAGTPEADRLGATPLIAWVVAQHRQRAYFVYAVRYPDGSADVGIMSMGAADAPSSFGAATPDAPAPTFPAAPPASPPAPASGWGIVVSSTTDPVEAEGSAARYRQTLASTGYAVAIRVSDEDRPRYRVVIGAFASAAEAQRALRTTVAGRVPGDAWLLPPGN